MRLRALVVVAAALLAAPVATAEVDARRLVLRQADVPAGYRLDPRETGVRTNALESQDAEARRLIATHGRTIGYRSHFEGGRRTIQSRADLFRRASGARSFLAAIDNEMRKSGIGGLVRVRVGLGAGGWVYTGRAESAFVLVVWSHRRAFAGLLTWGLSRTATIALARTQQRRIVSALR